MSFPITNPTPNYYLADGAATTIIWGTDGVLDAGSWGAYVCLRFSERPEKETLYVENGTGLKTGRIQIFHGVNCEITVRDDKSVTPPALGAKVFIRDSGGLINASNRTARYAATVIDIGVSTGPKQAMERTFTLERLYLVD